MGNSSTIQLVIDAQDRASSTLRRVNRETKNLNSAYRDFSGRISGLGRSFSFEMNLIKKAARVGSLAILGLGTAAIYFGKKAVDAAGRAEDIDTLFGLAFDETEQEMRDFADEFSDEFGRATTSIKAMASDLGYAISLGTEIGEESMAGMVKESVKVAEGLALSYDSVRDGEQAMRAIKQAYNGSNDSLQQLIPTIREEAILQRAVEMGLAATEAQVTRTARAEALHQMIMEGSVKSRQMLAEAEGTYTDTMLRYDAAVQEVSETVGGIFKPIVTETFEEINPLLQKFSDWVEENSPMIKEEVTKMANKIKEKIKEWYESVGGKEGIEKALKDLWKTLNEDVLPTIGKFFELVGKTTKLVYEHKETIWKAIKAFYAIKAALFVGGVIKAIRTFASAIGTATTMITGTTGLAAAIAALPMLITIGVVLGGFGLIMEQIKGISESLDAMDESSDRLDKVQKRLMDKLKTAEGEDRERIKDQIQNIADARQDMADAQADTAEGLTIGGAWKNLWGDKEGGGGGGAFQHGGAVTAGTPIMVGEHRPEVFVPSQSGNIRQMDQVGGGEVNVNFNNVSVRDDNDLQSIIDTVKKTLAREQELNSLGAR